jgi:hypothetical protein
MPLEPHPTDPDKMVYKSRQYQLDCPHCEYHKQRAQIWRDEAYKLSGHPLPERDSVLEEREACAKLIAKLTEMLEIQQKLHETAIDMLKPAIEIAVQKEREAIAHMVDPWLLPEYVEKIRARGQA